MKRFFQSAILLFAMLFASWCASGAVDILQATFRQTESFSASDFAQTLSAGLGLYALSGFLPSLLLAFWLIAFAQQSFVPSWQNIKVRLQSDEAFDQKVAAFLCAAAANFVIFCIALFLFTRIFAFQMANRTNAAVSTALMGTILAAICPLLTAPSYFWFARLMRVLRGHRTLLVIVAMITLSLAVATAALLSVDWQVIDFGPLRNLIVWLLLLAPLLYFRRRLRIERTAWLMVVVVVSILFSTCAAFNAWRLTKNDPAFVVLSDRTWTAKTLLRIAQKLTDRDGDGYSAYFGALDCRDCNADIHPGAEDLAGNGRDEDCDGEDTPLPKPRVARSETRSAEVENYRWNGNLLIITIDTLRADRLNPRTMPNLFKLAEKSIVFTHAYAQAPNTPRSFPSFLFSRFPSQVKWAKPTANFSPVPDVPENSSFFKSIEAQKINTIGLFSHFYMTPEQGVARGFDRWDNEGALSLHDSNTDMASGRILDKIDRELSKLAEKKGERFALWTHFFGPHSRYMEHAEFPIHSTGVAALEERYNGEVSYTDLSLAKLFAKLEQTGLAANTAIVVFSDHGEAFGEHSFAGERMFFHGQTLYDELLRVPLVFYVPGLTPRSISTRAMLVDLGPTLLDMLKAPRPSTYIGRSLLPAMLGETLADEPVYAEMLPATSWNHQWRAVISGDYKLIHKIDSGQYEFFQLSTDPTEQKNLAKSGGNQQEIAVMKALLRNYLPATK